jgi:hypothetical protein
MNNTSSFISYTSGNQSSFITAKEATAGPVIFVSETGNSLQKKMPGFSQ